MRILQLSVHYSPNIGGVETHLNDLVSGLIKMKHKVFVLTYIPLTANVKAKIWENNYKLQILRLPWITGQFYKLVKNPILEFLYLFPGIFFVTPFVFLLFRPEVVHTHGLIAGAAGVFWGKIFGTRILTTTHSLYHFPRTGIYRNFSKWIFSNSSGVLTLSKQSRNEINGLGVPKNKITVFTYWIELEKFKEIPNAKNKLGWTSDFVVFFAGRLVEEKGVLVLLESLKSWDKNTYLVIVGIGPLESRIKNQESKIKNLRYLGKIDNEKLPLYYSAADLTIVPSIHDEGFGRVILESLACGTPVVAANRGSIPEAMDNTVGKLIEITPVNIRKTIEDFYINRDEVKKLSKNASRYATEKYGFKNIHKIEEAYLKTS